MKFTIQPTERKEFVNLPAREREPDDFLREPRSRAPGSEREMLGQPSTPLPEDSISEPLPRDQPPRDLMASFLVGEDENEASLGEPEEGTNGGESPEYDSAEALWKRSKWPAAILLTALVMLGALWYFASRSDSDLMLAGVK